MEASGVGAGGFLQVCAGATTAPGAEHLQLPRSLCPTRSSTGLCLQMRFGALRAPQIPPCHPRAHPEFAPRIWQGFILPTRTGLLEEQGKGQPLRTLKVAARAQPPPRGHGDSPRLRGHGGGTSLVRCTTRPSGSFVPPAASRLQRGVEKGREGAAPAPHPKFLLEERSRSLQSLHGERGSGCLTDGNKLRVMNPGLN